MDFLDTNILVYAYDASHPDKQGVAQSYILDAIRGAGVVSAQVLAEFAAVLLKKRAGGETQIQKILDALAPISTVASDASLVRRAIDARREYGVHFYDGLIAAAAERANCQRIITEDLNPGQIYFGATAHNPFAGL